MNIDMNPKTLTVTVNGTATQYPNYMEFAAAYTAAQNAARPAATVSPRKAARLAQIEEMKQGGQ